jgi:3-oxoacyl-[acyl-carrier-protein] synthase III
MKLDAVKVALPAHKLMNQDVVSLIEQHSQESYEGDLDKALQHILFYLNYSGAQYRNWLAETEKPIDLVTKAINEALQEANCSKNDIDLLIYTGIDRGFIEPGGSYLVAQALGMNRVQCFDILDACMSWTRALYLANNLLQTQSYKRIMIINAEFNMRSGAAVYPGIYQLQNFDQIAWSFPGYTLGEAATATIVSADPDRSWEFHFSSRPDLADLCTVPLIGFQGYCHPTPKTGRNGADRFTSYGNDLHLQGTDDAVAVFQKLSVSLAEIRAIFPHASSKKAWEEIAGSATPNVAPLLWHIYPYCGNLVSASVPAGIALAINEQHLNRGDRFVGWVGSAGMSFCAYSSIY